MPDALDTDKLRDEMGWPIRMVLGTRVCSRPNCHKGDFWQDRDWVPGWPKPYPKQTDYVFPPSTEFRIDGYCSNECRDFHELEEEIATVAARAERLEAAARAVIASCARHEGIALPPTRESVEALAAALPAADRRAENDKHE